MKRAWVLVLFIRLAARILNMENNAGNPRRCALERYFIGDETRTPNCEPLRSRLLASLD
jgi:hypothetical protein